MTVSAQRSMHAELMDNIINESANSTRPRNNTIDNRLANFLFFSLSVKIFNFCVAFHWLSVIHSLKIAHKTTRSERLMELWQVGDPVRSVNEHVTVTVWKRGYAKAFYQQCNEGKVSCRGNYRQLSHQQGSARNERENGMRQGHFSLSNFHFHIWQYFFYV